MKTVEIFDLSIQALETIQKLTKLGGVPAANILAAVEQVGDAWFKARSTATTSDEIAKASDHITSLHSSISSNDAQIDAMIGDRR